MAIATLRLSLVAAVADLHGASFRIRNAWPGLWVGLLFPAGQGAGCHPGLECQAPAPALVAPSLPHSPHGSTSS